MNGARRGPDGLGVFIVEILVRGSNGRAPRWFVLFCPSLYGPPAVGMLRHVGDGEGGACFSEWRWKIFSPHSTAPTFSLLIQFSDDVPSGQVNIRLFVEESFAAWVFLGLKVLQLLEQLLPGKRRLEPIEFVRRHFPCAVASPIAQRETLLLSWSCRTNRSERIRGTGLVPKSAFPFLDQHARPESAGG